jgi:hypothetical protein
MVLIKHTIAILRNFISKAFLKRQSAGYKPKKQESLQETNWLLSC